ncbi:MAG: hypothetical protein R3Y28_08385 [Candidatus Gastranaerophilales bacterium]
MKKLFLIICLLATTNAVYANNIYTTNNSKNEEEAVVLETVEKKFTHKNKKSYIANAPVAEDMMNNNIKKQMNYSTFPHRIDSSNSILMMRKPTGF